MSTETIAIFWDYENARVYAEGINIPLAERLMQFSEKRGQVAVRRVYSNWEHDNAIAQSLFAYGFEIMHAPMRKQNSVDVMLAVDCISEVYRDPTISTVVLVTGDKDYIPLVGKLKREGKEVIILGPLSTSSHHLQLSAQEFVSFEQLKKLGEVEIEEITQTHEQISDQEDDKVNLISYEQGVELLIKAVEKAKDDDNTTIKSLVGNYMIALADEDLNYSSIKQIRTPDGSSQFTKLTQFLDQAEIDGHVKIRSIGEFDEIFLPDENPDKETTLRDEEDKHLTVEDYEIAINIIEEAFNEENDSPQFFMHLFTRLRHQRDKFQNYLSNRILRELMDRITTNLLINLYPNEEKKSNPLVFRDDYDRLKIWLLQEVANE